MPAGNSGQLRNAGISLRKANFSYIWNEASVDRYTEKNITTVICIFRWTEEINTHNIKYAIP